MARLWLQTNSVRRLPIAGAGSFCGAVLVWTGTALSFRRPRSRAQGRGGLAGNSKAGFRSN